MAKFIKEIIPYIIIVIAVVLIRTYIITPVTVYGPSMETTLYSNDIMLLYKFNKNNIKRYDIVVFKYGNDRLIKRVIGLPGDTIKCLDGKIYINNEEKSNEYGYGSNLQFSQITLKEDEYFVMGDNRENSLDSRYFGPVTSEQILGTTDFIIFPFNRFGSVN
ncbi:MAG: signal peptidase I [Erysipelotrichaceae bacterium]